VQDLYQSLQKQLSLLEDDTDELNRSVEFVEKDHERIRLGLTSEEVSERRKFITKIQSTCRILKRDCELIKQKNEELPIPTPKLQTSSFIYDQLENNNNQNKQLFMDEKYNLQQSMTNKNSQILTKIKDVVFSIKEQGKAIYQELNYQKPILEEINCTIISTTHRAAEITKKLKNMMADRYHKRFWLVIVTLSLIVFVLFLVVFVL